MKLCANLECSSSFSSKYISFNTTEALADPETGKLSLVLDINLNEAFR